MNLPIHRRHLPRARIFSRPVIISLAVLAALLASIFILKKRAAQAPEVDTLTVSRAGMKLDGQQVQLAELSMLYREGETPHLLVVEFEPSMPWGATWELRDTLKRLDEELENLTLTGLR